MNRNFFYQYFFILTVLVVLPAIASEKISITLPSISAQTFHQKIIEETLGADANYDLQPLKRAAFDFQHGKFSCFMGGSKKAMKDYYAIEVIESMPLLEWGIGIYTIVDNKTIDDKSQLANKSAVVVRGNTFLKNLKNNFNLAELSIVTSDQQAIAMLKAKRVDVAFYWYPIDKNITGIHRNKSLSLYKSSDSLVCHPNKQNALFIKKYKKKLEELKANGWLEENYNLYFQ